MMRCGGDFDFVFDFIFPRFCVVCGQEAFCAGGVKGLANGTQVCPILLLTKHLWTNPRLCTKKLGMEG